MFGVIVADRGESTFLKPSGHDQMWVTQLIGSRHMRWHANPARHTMHLHFDKIVKYRYKRMHQATLGAVVRHSQPVVARSMQRLASVRRLSVRASGVDSLDIPDIDEDLEGYQIEAGAVFRADESVPLSYGNTSRALFSIEEDAVVVDASNWSRLRISGPDAETFLHGQTSVNVKEMGSRSGQEACILTPQGRVIDLVLLLRMESGFLLICSPGKGKEVYDHFDKHIFMSDHVEITDVSEATTMFRVMGPKSNDILFTLQLGEETLSGDFGCHEIVGFDGKPLVVVKGSELGYSGYSLIIDERGAAPLWKTLVSGFGATPMGSDAWEIARIISGRPSIWKELQEPVTALDAGLDHAVSLDKGCYVGQEALSKMSTRDAIRWELRGFELEMPCQEKDNVYVDSDGEMIKAGKITSYVDDVSKTPTKHRALGFVKRSSGNSGRVYVGEDKIPAISRKISYI